MQFSTRFFLLGLLIAFASPTFAQPKEELSAKKWYDSYLRTQDEKDLHKARAKIDADYSKEENVRRAKTWLLRGQIYLQVFLSDFAAKKKAAKESGAEYPISQAYCNVVDSFLVIAGRSFKTALMLDTANTWHDEILTGFQQCMFQLQQMGASAYTSPECETKAVDCFYETYELNLALDRFDTASLYNATLAALRAKDFKRGIPWATTLVRYNYEDTDSWWLLGQCYIQHGDTVPARMIVREALSKYPGNTQIIYLAMDFELFAGNYAKADSIVVSLIGRSDWSEAQKHGEIGNAYDQLANPTASNGSFTRRPWNFDVLIARAELHYKKALELKPDYFDVQYDLGALYYNQGVFLYNNQMYGQEADTSYAKYFRLAVVELEKARALVPDDYDTLNGLKYCYAYLGETQKYQEVKEKLKSMKK